MQMGVSYKVVYPEKFLKAQAKREKEIVNKMDEVLRIREKQAALRAQQRIKRDKKKTTLKLNGWRNGYKIQKEPEAQLRPPDRQYDIRVYSLQDKCLWTMPELGEWYNAYAQPERPEPSDPLKGGYMVPRTATPPAPWHSHPKHHPQPVVEPPRLERMKTPPNMHDFEANLKQQRYNAEVTVKEGRFYPPQEPGRVRGYRAAPWMDRPE